MEATFVRSSPIIEIWVVGQTIRTTSEHPFYVWGHGWRIAAELQIGDVLGSHEDKTVPVAGIALTGEAETVYNLRVADYHTYFVGCDEWGFSVWAHNTGGCDVWAALGGKAEEFATLPKAKQDALNAIADHLNAGNKAAAKDLLMKEGLSQKKALMALDDLEFAAKLKPAASATPVAPATPAPLTLNQRVEQAVRGEFQVRGDPGHADLTLVDLGKPHAMANPEAGLGANQVRYQATFRRADGSTFNVSVNFDPETGLFGTIKPASGKK